MRIRSAIDRVMLQISMCRQQSFIAGSILELDCIQRQRRIYKPQLTDQAERRTFDMGRNEQPAHYGVASSPIDCALWQGTCTARLSGYKGDLDVNISYIG